MLFSYESGLWISLLGVSKILNNYETKLRIKLIGYWPALTEIDGDCLLKNKEPWKSGVLYKIS